MRPGEKTKSDVYGKWMSRSFRDLSGNNEETVSELSFIIRVLKSNVFVRKDGTEEVNK